MKSKLEVQQLSDGALSKYQTKITNLIIRLKASGGNDSRLAPHLEYINSQIASR